eukprot:g38933.t1
MLLAFKATSVTYFSILKVTDTWWSQSLSMLKRGDVVIVQRPESFWCGVVGEVVSVGAAGLYPVVVRFEKENYAGSFTC